MAQRKWNPKDGPMPAPAVNAMSAGDQWSYRSGARAVPAGPDPFVMSPERFREWWAKGKGQKTVSARSKPARVPTRRLGAFEKAYASGNPAVVREAERITAAAAVAPRVKGRVFAQRYANRKGEARLSLNVPAELADVVLEAVKGLGLEVVA